MASNSKPSGTVHTKSNALKDALAAALPEGFRCRVHYVHTSPQSCDPLFSPPPGSESEKTRLASHFLTVTSTAKSEAGKDTSAGVLVLGIEVFVYTTKHLTTIFVSKADSTGYLTQQRPSPVRAIATTFLQWLSAKERHKHPTRKLVISLFARSQSQYLFPGSAENPRKHVLDDRQLIKWWTRVLDPIFPRTNPSEGSGEARELEYNGYVTVPGYEGMAETRQFLPAYSHSSGAGQHWKSGNPLLELAETRGTSRDAPPRCLLPRFPDDPKARFMQDLDGEVGMSDDALATISPTKRKSGKWTSIRDLDRFWEAMEFRQECSSGRVVGFIWLVIRMKDPHQNSFEAKEKPSTNEGSQESSLGTLSSDPASQPGESTPVNSSPIKRRQKPLTGPIIPRQPRLKGGSSSLTATSGLGDLINVETADGLVLSKESYDKVMHSLLHLDFSDVEVATQSTTKWIAEVSRSCGTQIDWSFEVTGTARLGAAAKDSTSNGNPQVNDLGGAVRKKRKAGDQPVAEGSIAAGNQMDSIAREQPAVNNLSNGLIRKKPKPAAT